MIRGVVLFTVFIVGCAPSGTDLSGVAACGTMTCVSGELCIHRASGIDASPPEPERVGCATTHCTVHDCRGLECSRCLLDICNQGGPEELDTLTTVQGRDLYCGAQ